MSNCFKPNGSARYFSAVIGQEKKYVTLDTQQNEAGMLTTISKTFADKDIGLNYIDGRHLHTDQGGNDFVRFNITFDCPNDVMMSELESQFSSLGIKMREVAPVSVDWFAM